LSVLALMLAAVVPTFVVSRLLLLLVGPNASDLVLTHCASLLITGFAAGAIFTTESGFAGIGALEQVAAPQLFWLLVDLIRARSVQRRH
jgi:hypothetical protein